MPILFSDTAMVGAFNSEKMGVNNFFAKWSFHMLIISSMCDKKFSSEKKEKEMKGEQFIKILVVNLIFRPH